VRHRTCRTGDTRAWALPSGIIEMNIVDVSPSVR
jgi:hypothetical protein